MPLIFLLWYVGLPAFILVWLFGKYGAALSIAIGSFILTAALTLVLGMLVSAFFEPGIYWHTNPELPWVPVNTAVSWCTSQDRFAYVFLIPYAAVVDIVKTVWFVNINHGCFPLYIIDACGAYCWLQWLKVSDQIAGTRTE